MSGHTKKDTSEETGDSIHKVSEAWHDARDDAASSGHLDERNENKTSDSETGKELHSIFSDLNMIGKK